MSGHGGDGLTEEENAEADEADEENIRAKSALMLIPGPNPTERLLVCMDVINRANGGVTTLCRREKLEHL